MATLTCSCLHSILLPPPLAPARFSCLHSCSFSTYSSRPEIIRDIHRQYFQAGVTPSDPSFPHSSTLPFILFLPLLPLLLPPVTPLPPLSPVPPFSSINPLPPLPSVLLPSAGGHLRDKHLLRYLGGPGIPLFMTPCHSVFLSSCLAPSTFLLPQADYGLEHLVYDINYQVGGGGVGEFGGWKFGRLEAWEVRSLGG